VLPIGGLKEKLLAAHRTGLLEVIIPKDNEKDLAEMPANVLEAMKIDLVDTMDQVLAVALERPPKGLPAEAVPAPAEIRPATPEIQPGTDERITQ